MCLRKNVAAASSRLRKKALKAGHPWVIAHRGYRSRYPENTLAAFRAALAAGVDMIELDVMLSKDRTPVVIHDESLDRTTNGRGLVSDCTLSELQALDAGSWFDARFKGERLPALQEVLNLIKGKAFLNIEIKRSAYEPHHPPDAIEKQIVELVKRETMVESVLISSFEWRLLEHLVRMKEAPAIAVLSGDPDEENPLEACRKLGAFSWHPSSFGLKEEDVRRMHEANIPVFPYNVNTTEDIERMLEMGVDGLIVDDPLLVKAYGKG
jgi:glycerophosphoryl diester phosphodiesterase